MITLRSQAFFGAICIIVLMTCLVSFAQDRPAPRDEKDVPAGAERAVKAALSAYPGAVLEDVVTPSESIGLGGADGTFWTLHTRDGGVRQTLSVSADGVLIRSSKAVEPKDLPTTVTNGMAKVAPKGAARITKLETLGVVRYVALRAPEIRYSARVSSEAETVNVTVSPYGSALDTQVAKGPKKAPKVAQNARTENRPIPEYATKAVKAMREVFPSMVFDCVEEVPYIDSSTQTITMLWYEVEFFLGGVKHEFNATPDGIVIAYTKTIAAADLPKAAAESFTKAVANGKIDEVAKSETRARPRFVALDNPVVVYVIEPRGESGTAAAEIMLRTDGTEVQEPEWPDWVKKASKKRGATAR